MIDAKSIYNSTTTTTTKTLEIHNEKCTQTKISSSQHFGWDSSPDKQTNKQKMIQKHK